MPWSNGSSSQKALFPSQFHCCAFQLGNLVLAEAVATVISKECSRKYGLQMCSEGSQTTLGIHHLGEWTSLSPQSQIPDAQDSLFIVFSACASSDGQPYWSLCSKHSARVPSWQFLLQSYLFTCKNNFWPKMFFLMWLGSTKSSSSSLLTIWQVKLAEQGVQLGPPYSASFSRGVSCMHQDCL